MQHLFQETVFGHCLACGSDQLEVMQLHPGSEPVNGPFTPADRKLKWLRSAQGIALHGDRFQMCRACGLLFRQESPAQLRDFLARYAVDTPRE